jgi:hypothetical protein
VFIQAEKLPDISDFTSDTQDLGEIARGDAEGAAFVVAPGGRLILVHTFRARREIARDGWATDEHRVKILEAGGLNETATLEVEDAFYLRGFSPDGHYAYVERPAAGSPPATVFRVVDVGDGHVVAERTVDGYYASLLLNPTGGPDI